MIQLLDDGYHIVRLSGPVIILFSSSNSFYMDMFSSYVYFKRLGPTYATRTLHVEFIFIFIKVHFITTTRPISILLDK